jgi:hypothetical protein
MPAHLQFFLLLTTLVSMVAFSPWANPFLRLHKAVLFDQSFRENKLNPCEDQANDHSNFRLGQRGFPYPSHYFENNNWDEGCNKKDLVKFHASCIITPSSVPAKIILSYRLPLEVLHR